MAETERMTSSPSSSYQRSGRAANAVRPISLRRGFNQYAEGSAWLEWGNTVVAATVSVEQGLPPHLRHQKGYKDGWLNAEYALLPRSTHERVRRERLYAGGRTQEIQRLLGRAFRSVVRLELFQRQTLTVDIDIIQADGGTRCAGIVAGYAALVDMSEAMVQAGTLAEWALSHEIAAVSVGLVGGNALVDLEYQEDVQAEFDMNIIGTADGKLIEVQGGSESHPISAQRYVQLVAQGMSAVQSISQTIQQQLGQPENGEQA